jgi:5-methylcytosine-specific restriction endonuclease McrA
LGEGRSIESLARETGRSASTLAYWVNKYGLVSQHAERHRAKGPLDRARLESLVQDGRSVRQIATELEVSAATVTHWLRRYRLKTRPSHHSLRDESKPGRTIRECSRHGWTVFVRTESATRYRCGLCRVEAVSARRRRVKEILVRENGGACCVCGYDRYAGALQFHHVDAADKAFALSGSGIARSLTKARAEAAKCVLLCGNCHAEVEAGLATIPKRAPDVTER